MNNYNDLILRFFRDDLEGIMITNAAGEILYSDDRAAQINRDIPNWQKLCPPVSADQKAEIWELPNASQKTIYLVETSTFSDGDELLQVHFFIENSTFLDLYHEINQYSRMLREEKDHDSLTGLYNQNKFLFMKRTLFAHQDNIAIYSMDVNNLKEMNDLHGHEAGDRLLQKAAQSLQRISARNIMPFRVGGDEFIVVALHVSRAQAEDILIRWEDYLQALNQENDCIHCVMACGMVYAERGYDLEALLQQADQLMYEDKRAKKGSANIR